MNTKIKTPAGDFEAASFDNSDAYCGTSIRWNLPVILEMEDEQGVIHKYSLVEILDGLTRLAKRNKS